MNILVCVKQVQDNAVLPKLDAAGKVVTEGVETMTSPFDLNAVEAALKIAEEKGGEVSVITIGDRSAVKYGLSMGAAKAYMVNDPSLEDGDSFSTGYALAQAAKSIGAFDLILCGKQAIDDDCGAVSSVIAEQLGISQISNVNEIVEITEDTIAAKRVCPEGEEIVEAKLPALLTCEKSLNEPRFPTMKRTRMANRAEIPEITCASAGIETEKVGKNSPSQVSRRYTPAPRQGGELIKGDPAEIAAIAVGKLIEAKIV